MNIFQKSSKGPIQPILKTNIAPSWEVLKKKSIETKRGSEIVAEEALRKQGGGLPHTDSVLRLFGSTNEPRVKLYRDTAAWCPYCQKVWILLEEKKVPYRIEKINMRSYGDKPQEFLRKVPNGLLPAIEIDGNFQTESLQIMLNIERTFSGPYHPKMWPNEDGPEMERAVKLMRVERDLFSRWCSLVFRPSFGSAAQDRFTEGLDLVEKELNYSDGSWFLPYLSIVDLTYISHVERMCASVAYWSGLKIRGDGRWPNIERWMDSFEQLPSYMASKSDYYTHVMDIPPQYGPGFSAPGSEGYARVIDGRDRKAWSLPLTPFSSSDLEPVSSVIDCGEVAARHEAAYKICKNHEAVAKFMMRAVGSPGAKQFQAPLADPYAVPNLEYQQDVDQCLKQVTWALLDGYQEIPILTLETENISDTKGTGKALVACVAYLRDRVGVPRDMSLPAARQLRAYLNWVIDQLPQ